MNKYLIFSLYFTLISSSLISQELILTEDYPDLSWPTLWDIEQDQEGNLYTCSSQGILFVKSNGEWSKYDLNSDGDARNIAVDDNGTAWIATENGLYSFANNQIVDHFTSSNSNLPSNNLREIRAHEDKLWIVVKDNGLVLKQDDSFTHFSEFGSDLAFNEIYDIEVTETGVLVIGALKYVQFLDENNWTTYNLDEMFGYQTWVSDLCIDHNEDIWLATLNGVVKYNSSTNEFEHLKELYGEKEYSRIIYTPKNELWLNERFEGLHYINEQNNSYFFDGNTQGIPSQVFDFINYNDTVRVVGNIGATVTGLTVDLQSSNTVEKQISDISIFPNPTSDRLFLNIENMNSYQVSIFMLDGSRIFSGRNITEIDAKSLNPGLYLLQIKDNQNSSVLTRKIAINQK